MGRISMRNNHLTGSKKARTPPLRVTRPSSTGQCQTNRAGLRTGGKLGRKRKKANGGPRSPRGAVRPTAHLQTSAAQATYVDSVWPQPIRNLLVTPREGLHIRPNRKAFTVR